MAYIKHFSGFLIIATLLASIPSANSKKTFIPTEEPLRESSKIISVQNKPLTKNSKLLENYYSSALERLGINLRPGSEHRQDSKENSFTDKHCKSIVYKTLMNLPYSHRNQLKELTLYYTNDGRRGLGGNGSIILRCLNVTDNELMSVFTHEIGHLVDDTLLAGTGRTFSGFYDFEIPLSADDPSVDFYKISWENQKKQIEGTDSIDFVSMYAMTDPFEDFAETYTYYRLHGPEFRQLVWTSEALREKYNFMRSRVFSGKEFGKDTKDTEEKLANLNIWERNYDVTILPIL